MKQFVFVCLVLLAANHSAAADDPHAFASGSWIDPDRAGEGFVVQIIPGQRAVVTWFTYPPQGQAGDQAWLIGSGTVDGDRILITDMVRPVGAVFGPEFDPDAVIREAWGSLEIIFEGCDSATADWSGPPDFGSGSMDLVRLSAIDDVGCGTEQQADPDRVIAGRSGPWFDPTHNGEGWMLEMLPDGRMVVYWFTFDEQGRQTWLVGDGEVAGKTLWIEEMYMTRGTSFGDAFRAEDVQLEDWGSFGIVFEECVKGRLRYISSYPRFGEGTLTPEQIAPLAGTDCTEPPPVEPLDGGSWRLSAETDQAFSESASVGVGSFVYTGGGLGNRSRLLRFDPVSGTYIDMPGLPGQRHHPMMTTDGHSIYMAGGYQAVTLENPGRNFWKFDPEIGTWETLPDMPWRRAAGAAVYMIGRVWVMGGDGAGADMMSYDLETGVWELFPPDVRMVFDHMQAVAFENEIWWLGGRTERTFNRVLIWNPVTREWREGPPMSYPRSGFAARVVQGQIMVAGGESLDSLQVMDSMEVFAPGAEAWVAGPAPPIAVHGTTGASLNGEFILTAGSDIAGSLSGNRATQILTPAER